MDPDERFGSFDQRRVLGPKYFSLYPGATATLSNIKVVSKFGDGTMIQRNPDIEPMIDLKLPDWQLGKYFGISFLARNIRYDLNLQRRPSPPGSRRRSGSGSSSSSGSSGSGLYSWIPAGSMGSWHSIHAFGSSDSSNNNQSGTGRSGSMELGTRLTGNYILTMPVFYFGKRGVDHYKIGFGLGPANALIQGDVSLNGNINPLIFTNSADRGSYLRALGVYNLANGTDPGIDPIRSYLLLNIDKGNNLENYGRYLFAKGQIQNPVQDLNTLATYYYLRLNTDFNDLEILSILSLGNASVSTRTRTDFAWMLYWEVPFGDLNLRLSYSGARFRSRDLRFDFTVFEFATYMPIDF